MNTLSNNSFAHSSSSIVVSVGIKIAYSVSLSTITKMLSCPDDSGNSGMKSIETTSNGCVGMGIGWSRPMGPCRRGFTF